MKPPSDRLLDMTGAGIDLPAPARPRYGLRWPVVLVVATLLAVLSSALALSFTRALGKPTTNWMSLVRDATRREGDEQFAQLVEQNPELLLLDVPTITPESGGPVE